MKTYQNCPICEATSFNKFKTCKDNTGSDESFDIVKCSNCDFAFTNAIPLESEIGKYYESDEYISHSNTNKGLISSLYQKVRKHTLNKKVKLLQSLSKGKELLDIGSGTGEFLGAAAQKNFSVTGIEPSETGRTQAKLNFNIDILTEDKLSNLPSEHFDFISMWHVLEHVYHLNERVAELKRLLKQDGHIIIAVPNLTSLDAEIYQDNWAAYDVPRHLYHFSPKDMKALMNKHGLKLTQILPMKFDSFYVSMLSEKYKTGTTNLIPAFLNGLKSNLKGRQGNTFSSQIYIIKKV